MILPPSTLPAGLQAAAPTVAGSPSAVMPCAAVSAAGVQAVASSAYSAQAAGASIPGMAAGGNPPLVPGIFAAGAGEAGEGDVPPLIFGSSGGADDDGPIDLYDYQQAQIERVVQSILAGDDRGFIRAPTQTGKTMIMAPLIDRTRRLLQGKPALIISPTRFITEAILDDLRAMAPDSRIGIIDENHKDFDGDYDIVVASTFTIGRDEHLQRIDPNRFGLVIVDEATYVLANTWRKILTRLEFLDGRGGIRKNPGRYLLGLTADPYNLQKVFGQGASISALGIRWFMENGYLHYANGLNVRYGAAVRHDLQEMDGGEVVSAPAPSEAQSAAVVKIYRKYFDGRRVVIFTSSVGHAINHERAFDAAYGKGFAAGVHSRHSSGRNRKAVESYNAGTGPRVLISINMLSQGFRARGTEGVIHDYQTMSLRRFGQRTGRPLGRMKGEPQRTVLVVNMKKRGGVMVAGLSDLAMLMGVAQRFPDGIEYDPIRIKRSHDVRWSGRGRAFVPYRAGKFGLLFKYSEATASFHLREGRFQSLLKGILMAGYDGDFNAMSNETGVGVDELHGYIYGALPRTADDVKALAGRLGINKGDLVGGWKADALEAIEYLYPIPDKYGPAVREFIKLVRLATIEAVGLASVNKVSAAAGQSGFTPYHRWNDIFDGKFPKFSDRMEFETYLKPIRAILAGIMDRSAAAYRALAIMDEAIAEEDMRLLSSGGQIVSLYPEIAAGDLDDLYGVERRMFRSAATLLDLGGDEEDIHDYVANRELAWALRLALATLTPREERVVRKSFGFKSGECYGREATLKEVGDEIGTSQARAWQILMRAIRKLRHPSREGRLKPYLLEE